MRAAKATSTLRSRGHLRALGSTNMEQNKRCRNARLATNKGGAHRISWRRRRRRFGFLLMGFDTVLQTYVPRRRSPASLLEVLAESGETDPLLDLAIELEVVAVTDAISRSGTLPERRLLLGMIFRKIGIPRTCSPACSRWDACRVDRHGWRKRNPTGRSVVPDRSTAVPMSARSRT